MPLDIQSLKERGVKVQVPFFDGQPVICVYDPIKVSDPAFRSEYNKRSRELQGVIGDWVKSQAPQDGQDEAEGDDDDPKPEVDSMELSRRIWRMRGELVEMLLKDWEIESGGKHLAVSPDVFVDGTLPPELAAAIIEEVWSDVRALGNKKPSDNTR